MPPDDELAARLGSGDDAVFALAVDAWSPGMLRLARTFVSTDESAAEVVQEAWLAVLRGIDTFEGRSSLRTWVYRILANTAKRRGRGSIASSPGAACPVHRIRAPRSTPHGSRAPASRFRVIGASHRRRGRCRSSIR